MEAHSWRKGEKVKVGDYVQVVYKHRFFIGKIIEIGDNKVKIRLAPYNEDAISMVIDKSNIKKVLKHGDKSKGLWGIFFEAGEKEEIMVVCSFWCDIYFHI